MIELWLADVIILSVMFGLVFLLLITCKGHDLCHRQKKMGIFFMFISLNIIGLFWANKIFKKENPNFKFLDIFKRKSNQNNISQSN
ncbi:hypothetical protein [Spiroplasma endosymbiont of Villa modesta]|uniref:hypothetical protein n=1 Tax=Spiroplasma endosymbiont of Villa modesta TaxID=3066293 RepID=UPI00313DFDB7